MFAIPANADTNILHTVTITPATNNAGCLQNVALGSCTNHVKVTAPADAFPASSTVAVAECHFGPVGATPDPGRCDNRPGHVIFTKTDADGGLTQLYDGGGNPTGAPINLAVYRQRVGFAGPPLGGGDHPEAVCPPTDAQRAAGINCGVVVAQIDFGTGTIVHIGAATLWFTPTMNSSALSGASDVDITLTGDHWATIQSNDPIVCASQGRTMSGSPATCFINEAVRIYNGTRLIGAAVAGSHGQWSTSVHVPARTSGALYKITAKGLVSNNFKSVTYSVS